MRAVPIWIICVSFFVSAVSSVALPLNMEDADAPLVSTGAVDDRVPTPEEALGFRIGERPARPYEVVQYCQQLAESSARVELVRYGTTYQGRELVYLAITSAEHQNQLTTLQEKAQRLGDPRGLSETQAQQLLDELPAVIWMEHSIHGDELSPADSSLQLAYQLAAGQDEETQALLDSLIVCIDPLTNPDGRARDLARLEQWQGQVPNPDPQSLHHDSPWPSGRTNQYLFDLNRDWFILSQQESQMKARAILSWMPHVFIDAHEMNWRSTYLFDPPRPPFHPQLSEHLFEWWSRFLEDQAGAFDDHGFRYYTGEWNEAWYTGYASSFGCMIGAIGILYEQAQTNGTTIRQPDGNMLTFARGIRQHFVSSWANLTTAAQNRRALLEGYLETRQAWLESDDQQTYVLPPQENQSRVAKLIDTLQNLNIEVYQAEDEFELAGARDAWGEERTSFPAGTYWIHTSQPLGRFARSFLEFDPRWKEEWLLDERRRIEEEGSSGIYDVLGWSMLLAYDVECYQSDNTPTIERIEVTQVDPSGEVVHQEAPFGYLFSCQDDGAVKAAYRLLEKGHLIRVAEEPVQFQGVEFPMGSFWVQREGSAEGLDQDIETIAQDTGITMHGLLTAKSEAGYDLGGGYFDQLVLPKIALVGGSGTSAYSFGSLWHQLDEQYRMRTSLLKLPELRYVDLSIYNVLVFPEGSSGSMRRVLGDSGLNHVKEWVEAGGTLITVGDALHAVEETLGLNDHIKQVETLDEDTLKRRHELREAFAPFDYEIDEEALWGDKTLAEMDLEESEIEESPLDEDFSISLYRPRGVVASVLLDDAHWLSAGVGERTTLMLRTGNAYLTDDSVEVAGLLDDEQRMRLAGFLWPEAKHWWANTAVLMRDRIGDGQIIAFTDDPCFRAYFHGTGRIFLNAVLLGPGMGAADQPAW